MVSEFVAQTTALVRDNAVLAGPICFLLAFSESLAFVSFLVPSTILLVGVGALVGVANLSFWEVLIGATLGAAAGDWLSYIIGHRYGPELSRMWPLSRYPGMLERGQKFFERWGAVGIFVGRFLGPLRATIPLVAGSCAMPLRYFQIANVTSAAVWAFVLLAPGAFGARWLPDWFG